MILVSCESPLYSLWIWIICHWLHLLKRKNKNLLRDVILQQIYFQMNTVIWIFSCPQATVRWRLTAQEHKITVSWEHYNSPLLSCLTLWWYLFSTEWEKKNTRLHQEFRNHVRKQSSILLQQLTFKVLTGVFCMCDNHSCIFKPKPEAPKGEQFEHEYLSVRDKMTCRLRGSGSALMTSEATCPPHGSGH